MTDTSVSIADVGTTLASNGTVTSITLTTPPQTPGYYFTLVDIDDNGNYIDDIFNMQTSSMPFPTGTVFPLYDHPFTNLVLQSISPEGVFLVSTNP
jgi:hypothetical protein